MVELARDLWYQRILPFAHNVATRTPTAHPSTPVPADPTWPQQAGRIINRLNTACGHRAQRIDHIGSTAVPGMDAKDVIDIQITVAALEVADELPTTCCGRATPRRLHHHRRAEARRPQRRRSLRSQIAIRCCGTSAFTPRQTRAARPTSTSGWPGWPNQQFALVFVDWLTANPAVQSEYLAVKRAAGHHDVSGYVQARNPGSSTPTGAHGPGRTPPTGGRDSLRWSVPPPAVRCQRCAALQGAVQRVVLRTEQSRCDELVGLSHDLVVHQDLAMQIRPVRPLDGDLHTGVLGVVENGVDLERHAREQRRLIAADVVVIDLVRDYGTARGSVGARGR